MHTLLDVCCCVGRESKIDTTFIVHTAHELEIHLHLCATLRILNDSPSELRLTAETTVQSDLYIYGTYVYAMC